MSQPLVHEEPHHVPIFENHWVRVLEVTALPSDTTDYHVHSKDIAYYTIQGSKILLQEKNAEPRIVNLPNGWSGSNLTHDEKPFIHRFGNIGSELFKLVAIEVLAESYASSEFLYASERVHSDMRFQIQNVSNETRRATVPTVLIHAGDDKIDVKFFGPGEKISLGNWMNALMVQAK